LSHPTCVAIASSSIRAITVRRRRGPAEKHRPSNVSEPSSTPRRVVTPPVIIDAYIICPFRIVICGFADNVTFKLNIAVAPGGTIKAGTKLKVVLFGCSGEFPP
jgi:hypothetical protein